MPRRGNETDWGAVVAGVVAGAIGVGLAYALLTKKCPSCQKRVAKGESQCPNCGYSFGGVW